MAAVARLVQRGDVQGLKKTKNIRKLVQGFQPGTFQTSGFSLEKPTLLQLAVGHGEEDVVELLLGYGADPNVLGNVSFRFIMTVAPFTCLSLTETSRF